MVWPSVMKISTHEELRKDPLLAVLVEKCDPVGGVLAGKSTLNRLKLTPATASAKARYKKIVADHAAVDRLFVKVFLAAHPQTDPTENAYPARMPLKSVILKKMKIEAG